MASKLKPEVELTQLTIVRGHLEAAMGAYQEHGPSYRSVRAALRGVRIRLAFLEGGQAAVDVFVRGWVDDEYDV